MSRRSDRGSNDANIGCIWGLISMFNFRRESSKLLTGRRKRTKRVGSWYTRSKVKLLADPRKKQGDLEGSDQGVKPRQSVKKNVENEMHILKQANRFYQAESEQINFRHKTSSTVHTTHTYELADSSISELLERVSNNVIVLLEELSIDRKDEGNYCSHENTNDMINDHVSQTDGRSRQVQEHFMLQILEPLIYDDIVLSKQILSPCVSNEYNEIKTSLEILISNKELLQKVLWKTKPNLLKHIQDRQERSRRKTHRDQSRKHIQESDKSKHEVGGLENSEVLNINEPLLNGQLSVPEMPAGDVSQSSNRIVILKPHPAGATDSSDVSDPSSVTDTLYDIRTREKERPAKPIFFQDLKRRLRQFLGDTKKNHSIETDMESLISTEQDSQPSPGSKRKETILTPKDPCLNDEVELAAKYIDTDTMYSSDESIYPRKPKIDFADLLEYGDDDQKLKLIVSKSMKELFFFPENDTSTRYTSKDTDLIVSVGNVNLPDANHDTDVNFFRSSILNLEASTSIYGDSKSENYADCYHVDTHPQSDLSSEKPQPSMPLDITKNFNTLERVPKKTKKSSPASSLEPIFHEKFISPGSTAMKHVKVPFQEPTLVMIMNPDAEMSSCVNNDNFKYGYLRSLLEASGLCDGHISGKVKSPYQLLDPALYDEVETPGEVIPDDLRIFFDSINEVLVEIYEKSSTIMPWVSVYKPGVQPFPSGENLIEESWRGLNRFFVPHLVMTSEEIFDKYFKKSPWSNDWWVEEATGLDFSYAITKSLLEAIPIIEKDFETMDIRCGAEAIGFDCSDAIMESLVEEIAHEFISTSTPWNIQ